MTKTTRLTWSVLDNGDRLCHEHPILLVKPYSRGEGWEIKVPAEGDHHGDGLDRGDGWWWRSMWDVHGDALEVGNLKDTIDLVERAMTLHGWEDDRTLRELRAWVREAESNETWSLPRRNKIIEKATRDHEVWQKQLAEMTKDWPSSPSRTTPSKTKRADLLDMLDDVYDLLKHRHSTDSRLVATREEQIEALMGRIKKIVR